MLSFRGVKIGVDQFHLDCFRFNIDTFVPVKLASSVVKSREISFTFDPTFSVVLQGTLMCFMPGTLNNHFCSWILKQPFLCIRFGIIQLKQPSKNGCLGYQVVNSNFFEVHTGEIM